MQLTNRQIIYIVIGLIVLYLLYTFYPKIRSFFEPRNVDIHAGEPATITDERKIYLQGLAKNLYSDLNHTAILGGHNNEYYKRADALYDSELIYLAQYYKTFLSNGSPLYADINSDYFVTSVGSDLMAHLEKVGER